MRRSFGLIEAKGARFLLDTSGEELRAALAAGVFWSSRAPANSSSLSAGSCRAAKPWLGPQRRIVAAGQAELVAVTLGREGSILVGQSGAHFLPAVAVEVNSTVGAGDSFLAGMTYGLAAGHDELTAFRMAAAAGAAAVQSPGTDLCKTADVDRLLEQVAEPRLLSVSG